MNVFPYGGVPRHLARPQMECVAQPGWPGVEEQTRRRVVAPTIVCARPLSGRVYRAVAAVVPFESRQRPRPGDTRRN